MLDANAIDYNLRIIIKNGTASNLNRFLNQHIVNVNKPNRFGTTPLHFASCIKTTPVDMIQVLLDHKANACLKNHNGNTPLHLSKNKKISKLLLDNGANINCKNKSDETPLHLACNTIKSLSLTTLLLNENASTNIKDIDGYTPFLLACGLHSPQYIYAFLNKCYQINDRNNDGQNGLHIACITKAVEIVKILITYGININAKDSLYRTPLHFACDNDSIESVRILLENNAKTELTDKNGRKPLHYAMVKNFKPIIKLLLYYGVDVNFKNKFIRDYYLKISNENDKKYQRLLAFYLRKNNYYHLQTIFAIKEYRNYFVYFIEMTKMINTVMVDTTKINVDDDDDDDDDNNNNNSNKIITISYFDFLTVDILNLCVLLKIQNVRNIIWSLVENNTLRLNNNIDSKSIIQTLFPIYGNVIIIKFKRGIRKILCDTSKEYFQKFIPFYFPLILLDVILKLLNASDLINWILANNGPNYKNYLN